MYGYRPRSQEVIILIDDLCDFGGWVGGLSEVRTSVKAGNGSCAVCTFAFALQLKKSRKILTKSIQFVPDIDGYVLCLVWNISFRCYRFCTLCEFLQFLVGKKHPVVVELFLVPQVT